MPLQAIEAQRLYQQVARQISELIRGGEVPHGERLPSERDLARQLGVSRPVVREAVIALELAGLVEVRTGSGIYARAPDRARPLVLDDIGPSPFEVIAARRVIEPEIAGAAAAARSDADLGAIGDALDAMREALRRRQDLRPSDRLFHTRVAAATGNTVLAALVDELWEQALKPISATLHPRTGLPGNEPAALAEHAAILDALRARDSEGAREAMRAHLARVEDIMLAGDAATEAVARSAAGAR